MQSAGAARRIVCHAGLSHPGQLSQLLSPRGALAVQRSSPDERRMSFIEYPDGPAPISRTPDTEQFRADVLRGLHRPARELPCKYFYDETGSRLFEQICELEEYYLTRTELAIMHRHAGE